jgi:hypothetical protein
MYSSKSVGGAVYRPWEVKKKAIEETEEEESDQQTECPESPALQLIT